MEYLFAEFVDELIKDQVDLRLDLIVEKLLVKVVQCVVCTVAVQIQGIKDIPASTWIFHNQLVLNLRFKNKNMQCRQILKVHIHVSSGCTCMLHCS